MNEIERWLYWRDKLTEYFENEEYIEFGFLEEIVDVERDGYGGTNKVFYFENGGFYSRLSHWDACNAFANRSYNHTALNKEFFFQMLEEKKCNILQTLSEEEKNSFEYIFNDVRALFLKQFEKLSQH